MPMKRMAYLIVEASGRAIDVRTTSSWAKQRADELNANRRSVANRHTYEYREVYVCPVEYRWVRASGESK
jgi:hypothetical protein